RSSRKRHEPVEDLVRAELLPGPWQQRGQCRSRTLISRMGELGHWMFSNPRKLPEPMALRPSELAQVVEELERGLRSAAVQKAFASSAELWYLELRQPGRSTLLCLSAEPGAARISVAPARPTTTQHPPPIQARLRKLLVGMSLKRIRQVAPTAAVLELGKREATFW